MIFLCCILNHSQLSKFTLQSFYPTCILVPPPVLILSQSQDGENQLAGSKLTLTFAISVDSSVNTPHTVSVSWTRDGINMSSGGRIIVSDVSSTKDSNLYQAQLMFNTLSSTFDTGMYTSIVSVNSISSYPYVTTALPIIENININVTGKNLDYHCCCHVINTTGSSNQHVCEG